MNDDQERDRAVLRELEGDWLDALEAMKEVRESERRAAIRRLRQVRRDYRRLAIWLVFVSAGLLAVVVGGLWLQGRQTGRIEAVAEQTRAYATANTRALCALRHDLQERVRGGESFLLDHPHGIPGIPVKTLQVSIDGQRRTIRALSGLKCVP